MLPNSLLLKGAGSASTTDLLSRMQGVVEQIQGNLKTRAAWSTLALMALHATLCWLPVRAWVRAFSWLTLLSSLAHLALASFGWLYRYDTYLVAGNMVAVVLLLKDGRALPGFLKWTLLGAAVAVVTPRALHVWNKTPMAMDDRRWEHLMPAQFVRALPKDTVLMVNDLGVFAYDAHAKVIDMFGLGHNTPLLLRRQQGGFGKRETDIFAKSTNTELAILLPCWHEIGSRVPKSWELIGYWRGQRNVVANEKEVAVYLTDKRHSIENKRAIQDLMLKNPLHRNASVTILNKSDHDHLCEVKTK